MTKKPQLKFKNNKKCAIIKMSFKISLNSFNFLNSPMMALLSVIHCSDEGVEPPKYPWYHLGLFNSYDHAR